MKTKRIISTLLLAIMLLGLFSFHVAASTSINDSSIYFKQAKSNTCTLAAMGVTFRRKAVLDGNDNWQKITESSMKEQGNWPAGLAGSPKYVDKNSGLNMKASSKHIYNMKANGYKRNSNSASTISALKKELDKHPEGIVLYLFNRVSQDKTKWMHAVTLTGYDKNGNFYCADPASSAGKGIINLMNSILTDSKRANTSSLEELLSYSVKIWYISSSSNTKTNSGNIENSSKDNSGTVVKKTKPTINVTQYPTTIEQGKSFGLRGTISSENNITSVKGYIINSSGSTVMSTTDSPNAKSNNIRYLNLNEDMVFGGLSAGNYTLKIVAKDSSGGDSATWEKSFTVKSKTNTNSNNTNTSTNTSSSSQTITDGTYVIATKLNTNYVLDIADASKDNGANLQLWKNNGTAAQTFKVTHVGNGYYQIVNTNSGKAIDVQNGDTAAGTNVWQYKINNSDAQLWKIVSAGGGSYYIIGKGSGLYLDVDNANADYGTNVKIFDKNDAYDAQKWIFAKTSSNSSSSSSSSTSSSSSSQTTTSSTSIRFEIESMPKGNLPYGKSFSLKGWFRSDSAIVEARAYMLDANKNIVMQSDPASSTTSNYKIQGYKLDKAMKFDKLSPGGYYLKLFVRDANGDTFTWVSDKFYIVK